MSSPHFNADMIQYQRAAASYNHVGEAIKQGKKKPRLTVNQDERLHVAAKIIYPNSSLVERTTAFFEKRVTSNFVEVRQGKNRVILNINSVANRYHLTPKEVKAAARLNNGQKLIDILNSKQTLSETLSHYNTMIQNYDKKLKKNKQLILNKGQKKSAITPKTLMKVVKTAVEQKFPQVESQDMSFHMDSHEFIAKKSGSDLQLVRINHYLAAGSFAKIYTVTDLKEGTEQVLKKVNIKEGVHHTFTNNLTKQNIIHEIKLLNKIHEKGNVWGIQSKPRQVVNIEKSDLFGFIGERYTQDFYKLIISTVELKFFFPKFLESMLFETHQLLYGLKEMHEKGIVHRDIKPENILVKSLNQDRNLAHLADFGGARDVGAGEPLPDISSPHYFPIADQNLEARLMELDDSHLKQFRLMRAGQKSDVFALGCSLYGRLSLGESTFEFDENNRPLTDNYIDLQSDIIPQKINDLIKQMVASKPKDRVTAVQAFDILEEFIKESFPGLYEEIQQHLNNYQDSSKNHSSNENMMNLNRLDHLSESHLSSSSSLSSAADYQFFE